MAELLNPSIYRDIILCKKLYYKYDKYTAGRNRPIYTSDCTKFIINQFNYYDINESHIDYIIHKLLKYWSNTNCHECFHVYTKMTNMLNSLLCPDLTYIIISYMEEFADKSYNTFYKNYTNFYTLDSCPFILFLGHLLVLQSKIEPVIYNRKYGCVFILCPTTYKWISYNSKIGRQILYTYDRKYKSKKTYYCDCKHDKHHEYIKCDT